MTGTLREDQYTFDLRRSVHHSTIHKVKPRRCSNVSKFYMKLNMFRAKPAHHQEPKLHWQPLVFYTRKVVVRIDGGRCQAQYVPDNVQCAVLGF